MVRYLDLRLCMVVLINKVKSPKFQIGGGVSWEVMTWTDIFTFILVLSAFSFVSIEVPLSLTTFSFHIRLRFGNWAVSAAVSFMASVVLPQPVFWFVYPVMLLLFFYPKALRSLQAVIPINLVYDIFITTEVVEGTTEVVEVMNEPAAYSQQDLKANIYIEAAE